MKKILLSICALTLGFLGVAQNEIIIEIDHKMGEADLVADQVYATGYDYDVTIYRLEYYLSELEITHDGGQVTPIADTWLLVNALEETSVNLGSYDIDQVESISFGVGVDEAHNHLDPASWPVDHPLNYQAPSMHWGWSPGYRFVCLEGNTGISQLLTYEIHALGDENYDYKELDVQASAEGSTRTIAITGNYLNCYQNCDVSGGVIEHSTEDEAAALLHNLGGGVFSATVTSVNEVEAQEVLVYPNPTSNGNVFVANETPSSTRAIEVRDLTGRLIATLSLNQSGTQQVQLPQQGIYLLSTVENGIRLSTQRVIYK